MTPALLEPFFRREAAKALRTMPRTGPSRVRAALQRLSENPLRTDLDLRPLRGRTNTGCE